MLNWYKAKYQLFVTPNNTDVTNKRSRKYCPHLSRWTELILLRNKMTSQIIKHNSCLWDVQSYTVLVLIRSSTRDKSRTLLHWSSRSRRPELHAESRHSSWGSVYLQATNTVSHNSPTRYCQGCYLKQTRQWESATRYCQGCYLKQRLGNENKELTEKTLLPTPFNRHPEIPTFPDH